MPGIVGLVWSAAGRRLIAVGRREIALFDGSGRRLASRRVRAGFELREAQWSPIGDQIALVRRSADAARSEIVLLDAAHGLRSRVPFKGPGEFGGLAWSPSGARLLVGWPDADQWLFLRPQGDGRLSAVANIARQFMPGADRPAFPRAVEWCCRSTPPRVRRRSPTSRRRSGWRRAAHGCAPAGVRRRSRAPSLTASAVVVRGRRHVQGLADRLDAEAAAMLLDERGHFVRSVAT